MTIGPRTNAVMYVVTCLIVFGLPSVFTGLYIADIDPERSWLGVVGGVLTFVALAWTQYIDWRVVWRDIQCG